MDTSISILAIVTFLIYLACKIARNCFDDQDPDLNWYNNYAAPPAPPKPLIGFYGNRTPIFNPNCKRNIKDSQVFPNTNCKHKGEKTLVTQYASVNCEQVNLICDTCGKIVEYGKIDCR